MKLLYCNKCEDVVRLKKEEKSCDCGLTKGHYINNLDAVYSGPCIPLGFNNFSLMNVLDRQPMLKEYGYGDKFEAFTIPNKCDTFIRQE